jgi:autoinducer 2-degrading protein
MVVNCVSVWVRSEHVEDFIAATRENHRASVREPGNLRFDVLQSREDPARFLLYEAYADAAGAEAHKRTAHYLTWRETVAPWMSRPREGAPYLALAPAEEAC